MKLFSISISIAFLLIINTISNSKAEFLNINNKCHNSTGSCLHNGFFLCANEEIISHNKRCNNIEECADGTDEYLCDMPSEPFSNYLPKERNAIFEVSCVKCTCLKGSITISNANIPWFTIAKNAPRAFSLMTDAPLYQNKPCNPTQVTSIKLNVYKKQNKGCRGWVCCFRQEQCVSCSTGTSATHCY